MKIRHGDMVQVVVGEDAGPAPRKVIQVHKNGKLTVEGVNRVYKHVRRGHPKSPQGGRLNLEMPIDGSNCMLYCDSCNRGTRVGYRFTSDGKERFCRKCGASLGAVSSPKEKRTASSS